jgi:pSer/pThr/pTyr-binding forkhead associated (FHA) protein
MARPDDPHAASPAELKERLETERAGEPFLLYRVDAGQRIVTLGSDSERFSVGRDPGMDLSLADDDQVSLLHAELYRIGGQWTVVDDGLSRNGTFLNGERTSGRKRLRDGDELRFGETVVVFRDPASVEVGETAAAPDGPAIELTPSQRKILLALCRPYRDGSAYATPSTNKQIAEEVFLSVDAVKGHLRQLFDRFGLGDVPQNQKRVKLVELAMQRGLVTIRDL